MSFLLIPKDSWLWDRSVNEFSEKIFVRIIFPYYFSILIHSHGRRQKTLMHLKWKAGNPGRWWDVNDSRFGLRRIQTKNLCFFTIDRSIFHGFPLKFPFLFRFLDFLVVWKRELWSRVKCVEVGVCTIYFIQ